MHLGKKRLEGAQEGAGVLGRHKAYPGCIPWFDKKLGQGARVFPEPCSVCVVRRDEPSEWVRAALAPEVFRHQLANCLALPCAVVGGSVVWSEWTLRSFPNLR